MPEPLIYNPSTEPDDDEASGAGGARGSFHPYATAYRTKGPASPSAAGSAPTLVRLPSDASSASVPVDPASFPLPHEYRFGGGSQVGSSAASVSSAGGGSSGWRQHRPSSSARDSGASFGDYSTAGAVERRSAYDERDLPEEREEALDPVEAVVPSPVDSAGSVHFQRFSAQPAWGRTHRPRPSVSDSLHSSPASSSSQSHAPQPPTSAPAVVGLGFSHAAVNGGGSSSTSGSSTSAHAGPSSSSSAHASRESSTHSPSAGGSRWSHAFSHSAASSTCGRVAAYDSEDDKSDDGTSETSQYDWGRESSDQRYEPQMAEGAAVVLVEDGRGKVVAGDALDLTKLDRLRHDLAGSTHLLLSSTSTPDLIPAFIREVLPSLDESVVVLDISSCRLSSFPPEILGLPNLEELDVSHNPLRTLPPALGQLHSLRVLAANAIGCSTLPAELGQLPCLHTLSVRNNRFYALPRWLCLLANLETLLVEGNPFQGFWQDFIKWRLLQWSPLAPDQSPAAPVAEARDSPESFFSASSHPYAQSLSPDALGGGARPGSSRPPSGTFQAEHMRRSSSSASSTYDRQSTLNAARYGQRPSLPTSFASPWPDDAAPSSSSSSAKPAVSPGRSRANTSFQSDANLAHPSPPLRSSIAPLDGPALPSTIGRTPVRRMKSAGALFQAAADHLRAGSAEPMPSPDAAAEDGAAHRLSNSKRFVSLGKEKGRATSGSFRKASDGGGGIEMLTEEGAADDPRLARRTSADKDKGKFRTMFKKMSMGRMRSGSGTGAALRPAGPPHLSSAPSVPTLPAGARAHMARRPSTSVGYASSSQAYGTGGADYPDSRGPSPSSFQLLSGAHVPPSPGMLSSAGRTAPKAKRRSFLNFDGATPSLNAISIPTTSPFLGSSFLTGTFPSERSLLPAPDTPPIAEEDHHSILESYHTPSPAESPVLGQEPAPSSAADAPSDKELLRRKMYADGLGQIMAYLQDLYDLSLTPVHPPVVTGGGGGGGVDTSSDRSPMSPSRAPSSLASESAPAGTLASIPSTSTLSSTARRTQRLGSGPLPGGDDSRVVSMADSDRSEEFAGASERKYRSDSKKRARVLTEIISTEETYVKGLRDLVHLYVRPSEAPVPGSRDTVIPAAERKVVFNGLSGLLQFHEDSFLPSLRTAAQPVLDDLERAQANDAATLAAALRVADVFRCYNPFMRMYSTYINGFDNALLRLRTWTETSSGTPKSGFTSPNASSVHVVTMGLSLGGAMSSQPGSPDPASGMPLTTAQRKRMKHFLRDAQAHPRHTQINLESYLLLPVQRIPRYKMLLDQLCQCTPPRAEDDNYILEDVALDIAALASSMNEEKRESESRQRLVQWQSRITGKFPSPLVQPHRKLLLDGTLVLQKFIKRVTHFVEVVEPAIDDGDNTIVPAKKSVVPVEVLESSDSGLQKVVVVLTSDLMILCQMGASQDPEGPVDLYAVLRLQTKPQPASILPGTSRTIRVVDDKAILYLEAPNTSAALTWVKALNESFQQSR